LGAKTTGNIIELDSGMLPTSTNLKKNRKENNETGGTQKKGKGGQTKKGKNPQVNKLETKSIDPASNLMDPTETLG
jgi:hypothetical protein